MSKRNLIVFLSTLCGLIFNAQEYRFYKKESVDTVINQLRKSEQQLKDSSQLIFKLNQEKIKNEKEIESLKLSIKSAQTHHESLKGFNYVYLIAALLALVAVIVLITTIKEKKVINKQLERQHQLTKINAENLKEKNQEITDSIKYARRIQEAMLPSKTEVKNTIPNSFIYYRPKDIVSGDFYWVGEKNGKTYVVTADCTGHGVPGALMSMLGISSLNEIINEKNILSPGKILDELRSSIVNSLSKSDGDSMKDGMDLSLYCYDKRLKRITYAAANNGIYVVRDNSIIILNPDKQPVGASPTYERPFTEGTFDLKNDDLIITFTDGFADQFGGPKGKKFKYKQLQELIIQLKARPIYHVSELLNQSCLKWKGKLEQVDDVLIIGLKV
ncbi:MAG: PP2C family protein-serine/threonine phosphatase [Bacteroidota bacterium]